MKRLMVDPSDSASNTHYSPIRNQSVPHLKISVVSNANLNHFLSRRSSTHA